MELWAIVEESPKYEVSSLGRVRNKVRQRLLKPVLNEGGYHKVNLPDFSGKSRVKLVHRLVAKAFIGPPTEGRSLVDHIDHNRINNDVRNLRWASRRENLANSDWGVPVLCSSCRSEIRGGLEGSLQLVTPYISTTYPSQWCGRDEANSGTIPAHSDANPLSSMENPDSSCAIDAQGVPPFHTEKGRRKGGPRVLFNALSHLKARGLPAGKYADGQGLWLFKTDKPTGKWVLRIIANGKRREMGMGRWPDVSIGEARDRSAAARRELRDGVDPIEKRKRDRRPIRRLTLSDAVSGCFEARKAELKDDGEAGRWLSPLTVHVLPRIGKYPVEQIDQHMLKELFEPLWNTKPESAEKALNRLNLALKHAAALGLNVDLQATMKTRALLGKQRRTLQHIPSLPYEETPDFYKWLAKHEGVSALALRFLMLTLARTSEVRLTPKTEIEGTVWNLPGERTKTGLGRKIPLVKEAVKVIGKCKGDWLFPAYKGKPLSDMAMAKLMKDRGMIARPHGFRATFRTWAEEQTEAAFEVKEAVLGHVVDTGTVGAYQRSDRSDKRRLLMEKWETFLLA